MHLLFFLALILLVAAVAGGLWVSHWIFFLLIFVLVLLAFDRRGSRL